MAKVIKETEHMQKATNTMKQHVAIKIWIIFEIQK